MNREARRLEKEIKEVLEEMSSDEEIKVILHGDTHLKSDFNDACIQYVRLYEVFL